VYFGEPTATEPRPAVLQTFVDGRLAGTPIEVPDYVWSAVSPRGHRVAIGTIDGVRVFDGESGAELWADETPDLRGVFITLADDLIVSSLGGELQVRDLDTGEVKRSLGGSRGFVQEVHSTADGSMIAIRGGDGTIGLFDVASGVQIGLPITISDDEVTSIALALDGTTLAAGGGLEDGVALWDLRPESWIAAACALAGRDLTEEEWDNNIGDLAEYRSTCGS
jgi:WD40 repeat protein